MKNLKKNGKNTLAEILNVDPMGIWVLVKDREYFLGYDKYPWFLSAKIADIFSVKLESENHLRWDSLDIDLDVQFLENPSLAPLTYQ